METAPSREEERSGRAAPARLALVLVALAAFLPGIPGWWIAWTYHAIPRLPAVVLSRIHDSAPGAPPLFGAEAVAVAPDGTLFVGDWTLRHVLAVRPPEPGRWLPPEGRFQPRVGQDGRLHLLDVDTGVLYRYSPSGHLERRASVAPPGSSPLFCIAPDGNVLVAAAGVIRRFAGDLGGLDTSWGPPPHAVPAPQTAGLAASSERVYAASRTGIVTVYSLAGALLARAPLVGNAGALEAGPNGRLVLADRRTGRLFLLATDGRTVGRLVSAAGTAPVSFPAGLAFAADGRLAVAEGRTVALLAPLGGP